MLDDIREIMFDEEAQKITDVKSLMHRPPDTINLNDSMHQVMRKFEKTGAWNLPVLSDGKYEGFLSKSTIFNAYRNNLRRKKYA